MAKAQLVLISSILFVCFWAWVGQCGPSVPPASYAEIRYTYYSYSDMYARYGGSVIEIGFMALYTDMQNQKLFLNCSAYDSIAPSANSVLNSSLLYQNSAPTYQVNNHQCYESGNAYGDFYWWIENAQFSGYLACPFYDKGSTCSLYTYRYESTAYTAILTSNNYIQQLNITDYFEERDSEYTLGYLAMDFHLFQPYITNNPFVSQPICATDQSNNYFCPRSSKISQTIYYLHHYGDTNISPNVGDLLGYTAYLCWKSSLGDDQILTQAVVEMDPTWGQFSVCYSFVDCVGGNSKSVGRECPYGFEYLQAQCANLTDYGQWFSITNDARCPLTTPVGNGCAWHFKYYVKSISFQCLLNQGLFDACYNDGQIPFNNAAEVVSLAFQYCPAVTIQSEVAPEPRNINKDNHYRHSSKLEVTSYPIRVLKSMHSL